MRKTFPPFTPVCVEWEDACHETSSQYDSIQGCLNAYKPALRKTYGAFVGWARRGKRTALMVATDDDRAEDGDESVGGPFTIPEGMVINIIEMKRTTSRRRRSQ